MANALMLGFGGSGAQTLTFEKEISVWKEGKAPDHLGFLLFDTIKGWQAGKTVQILGGRGTEKLAQSKDKAANLDENREYFHLTDRDPDLNRQVSNVSLPPHLANWLHTQWLALHVPEAARSIEEGAAQQRQIGRFAVFQNAIYIRKKLTEIFQKTKAANVWLIASAAGGTGAGGLLDAALLARLAAKDANIDPKITGVVVLPEVYADKAGISKGRAYSLFRELERFQERGFRADEDAYRYVKNNENITVKIDYDNANQTVATRGFGGLFDYLFYVGKTCNTDSEREAFFSSVANAVDPYLDEVAGPRLLQASVNEAGKLPSGFGASRVYLPIQTLADLFSWEEVQSYVDEVTAPVIEQHRVVDVAAGPPADRAKDANEAFDRLLPFFAWLKSVAEKDSVEWGPGGLGLSPVRLVEQHLQFANPQAAGFALMGDEARLSRLTYRNPYISLSDAEENVPAEQRRLKTRSEAARTGIKEDLESSRQRFQKEVDQYTGAYRNEQGGEGSFSRGAEIVRTKLTERLRARVDDLVIGAFNQAGGVGKQGVQGTVLTRQYKVLEEMLADHGPVSRVKQVLAAMRSSADDQARKSGQRVQQAVTDLKEWRPTPWWQGGMFTNSSSLVRQQDDARSVAADAAKAYQRNRLLDLVDELMQLTEERLAAWRGQLREMLNGLVLSPAVASAYGHARGAIDELNTRLQRQLSDPKAIVDPVAAIQGLPLDPSLRGYRARLKQETTNVPGQNAATLAADILSKSRWRAEVDDNHKPRLLLDLNGTAFDGATVSNFATELARNFRFSIDRELRTKDVFDYLLHCADKSGITPTEVSALLEARAEALINVSVPDVKMLTYAIPRAPVTNISAHVAWGQALVKEGFSHYDHSDRFSVCLLKVKKPADARHIQDIDQCLQDYLRYQTQKLQNVQFQDDDLRRAEVYHIFRAEMEAWYLERDAFIKRNMQASAENHIPPRIVRLLDDPERMQAFVRCLATGAIMQDTPNWVWIDSKGTKVFLNDPKEQGNSTVVRAAVNFILRRQDGTLTSIRDILLDEVNKSVAMAVSRANKSEADLLREFAEPQRLEEFLDRVFPKDPDAPNYQRERHGLEMIFTFYATPGVSMALVQRMLPS